MLRHSRHIAKGAYAYGIDAPMLLALRFLVAAIALWAILSRLNRQASRVSLKELRPEPRWGSRVTALSSFFQGSGNGPDSVVGLLGSAIRSLNLLEGSQAGSGPMRSSGSARRDPVRSFDRRARISLKVG